MQRRLQSILQKDVVLLTFSYFWYVCQPRFWLDSSWQRRRPRAGERYSTHGGGGGETQACWLSHRLAPHFPFSSFFFNINKRSRPFFFLAKHWCFTSHAAKRLRRQEADGETTPVAAREPVTKQWTFKETSQRLFSQLARFQVFPSRSQHYLQRGNSWPRPVQHCCWIMHEGCRGDLEAQCGYR